VRGSIRENCSGITAAKVIVAASLAEKTKAQP